MAVLYWYDIEREKNTRGLENSNNHIKQGDTMQCNNCLVSIGS